LRRVVEQRLVGLAQRVLQRVEDLRELEAQEPLRVEAGDPVALLEAGQFAQADLPELVRGDVRRVQVGRERAEPAPVVRLWVDREMPQLLIDEGGEVGCAGGVTARTELPRE
jgi:hypothetical protein